MQQKTRTVSRPGVYSFGLRLLAFQPLVKLVHEGGDVLELAVHRRRLFLRSAPMAGAGNPRQSGIHTETVSREARPLHGGPHRDDLPGQKKTPVKLTWVNLTGATTRKDGTPMNQKLSPTSPEHSRDYSMLSDSCCICNGFLVVSECRQYVKEGGKTIERRTQRRVLYGAFAGRQSRHVPGPAPGTSSGQVSTEPPRAVGQPASCIHRNAGACRDGKGVPGALPSPRPHAVCGGQGVRGADGGSVPWWEKEWDL